MSRRGGGGGGAEQNPHHLAAMENSNAKLFGVAKVLGLDVLFSPKSFFMAT